MVREVLLFIKPSASWVPRLLNADEKGSRKDDSRSYMEVELE